MQLQRMDAAGQLVGQRVVHQAMPGDARQAGESRRLDLDAKMRFAAGPMAGVADMLVRIVDDAQTPRRRCRYGRRWSGPFPVK